MTEVVGLVESVVVTVVEAEVVPDVVGVVNFVVVPEVVAEVLTVVVSDVVPVVDGLVEPVEVAVDVSKPQS